MRALLAVGFGALLLAAATPASAKVGIAEAHIGGPGLSGAGVRISGPATKGMWEAGLDWAGGLDDTRADSVIELGLAAAELGPKYVVTFRLDAGTEADEIVRQDLYPYAKGGPVTFTPPGQRIADGLPWEGTISPGWYQSSFEFFHYLVDQGLPESNPFVPDRGSSRDTVPPLGSTPWGWIALASVGLVALSVAAPRLRRRFIAVARAHR